MGHVSDYSPPSKDDVPSLTDTRKHVVDKIGEFLHPKPPAKCNSATRGSAAIGVIVLAIYCVIF
jgi:hypothetical protein